jgi:hypothetical protein
MLLLAARAPAPQRDAEENKQQAKEPALSKKRRHTAGRKDSSKPDQEGDDPPRHLFALKDIPKSAAASFLQRRIQIFYCCFEHFITSFANSFGRWLDFDVRLDADALQLSAIGVTHIVAGEADINPAR